MLNSLDLSNFSFVYTLFCCSAILYFLKKLFTRPPPRFGQYAPSPPSLPIVGHLHLLAKYSDDPWKGFEAIRQKYGDVVSLQLGTCDTIMVSSLETIKEVLINKGKIFSDRPDFYRYHFIFGGDRENALALCDWSDLQKVRRALCAVSTTPKFSSNSFEMLDQAITSEIGKFLHHIESSPDKILTKCLSRQFSSNVFTAYLCAHREEYGDFELIKQSLYHDHIFFHISQCGPIGFLPFFGSFRAFRTCLKAMDVIAREISDYLENMILKPRIEHLENTNFQDGKFDLNLDNSTVFLDLMYKYHLENHELANFEHFLFSIADLIGGSAFVSNLLMRIVGHLAMNHEVQEEMYQEVVATARQHDTDIISLKHRKDTPLTEASILEALRLSSSPIVPHVPTEDTTVGGYFVPKGTMILFNNWRMNFSTEFYEKPELFEPSRFLHRSNNNSSGQWQIKKPEVFMPFSMGQRSCLGLKLVQNVTFAVLSNILLRYKIEPASPIDKIKEDIKMGILALRVDDCFRVQLIPRE